MQIRVPLASSSLGQVTLPDTVFKDKIVIEGRPVREGALESKLGCFSQSLANF